MSGQFQYDPKDVVVVYGALVLTGFADGTFVKVAMNEDDFGLKVGADGEGCRVRKRNKSATVEVTLLQSSASNAALSASRALDIETPEGLLGKQLSITTSSGNTFFAAAAWIKKMPDVEFSKDVEHRMWVFEMIELEATITGDLPLV